MNTEIGCIARANPYDVTLEEHMKAHVGWYIWELMITKRWGNVHGVFYPDGTVRDPAIPAAMFGLFRNRSDNVILENVNRESWVNTDIAAAQAWLDNPAGNWKDGLNAAEKLANLLEGAQLIAMREPPTRTIEFVAPGAAQPGRLARTDAPSTSNCCGLLSGPGPPRPPASARAPCLRSTATRTVYPIPRRDGSRTPVDTSTIRGANYCYAEYGGHRACGTTIRRPSPSAT